MVFWWKIIKIYIILMLKFLKIVFKLKKKKWIFDIDLLWYLIIYYIMIKYFVRLNRY